MKATPVLLLLITCAAAQAQTPIPVAYTDESGYTQGGWTDQQRWQRRREAKLEWRAETLRIGQLLQPSSERKAAAYASNNQRCHLALQIAALCGTAARPFSCDAKGFHYDPPADDSTPRISGVVDHASTFKRQQCALQLTKGR